MEEAPSSHNCQRCLFHDNNDFIVKTAIGETIFIAGFGDFKIMISLTRGYQLHQIK